MFCFQLYSFKSLELMSLILLLQQWWEGLNLTTVSNPFLLSILLISIVYLFKISRSSKLNLPPSPPKLPIIGNLHQVGKFPHRSFRSLSEKYGPLLLLQLGQTPTLVVSSSEIGKEVLSMHDAFLDRPRITAARVLFYGCSDMAFCPYGEYWRQVKKLCVVELLTQKRVQAFQLAREEEVSKMVQKIRQLCNIGSAIDLCELFATISNNIISRSVLGQVYESEGNKNFGELSRKAMDLIGAFCFKDFVSSLGWMDVLTGLNAKLDKTSRELGTFIDQVIEEHQVLPSNDDKSENKDFVDIILHLQKDGLLDFDLSRENIRAILLDMLIGGTDNTASTMEWAMAELVKNPAILKKAQEEVRRIVGEKSIIPESDINQMNYLICVVKETLRLHAPVMVSRQTPTATKLRGYDIPPKTIVLVNAWAIQRDPELWNRPEEFIPERFLNSSVDFKGQQSHFIPFGSGKRGCPGTSFAAAVVEFVLANLLHWFDWKLPDAMSVEDLDMNDFYALVIRKRVTLRLVPLLRSS